MYVLAFDTSVNFCNVVLMKDKKVVDCYEAQMVFGQSEALMPQIKEILEKNNLTFQDLSLLAVCTGPGSFTGVRSSISAARAFSLASPKLTVCGVSAFEAYKNDFSEDEIADVNVILIETKREDFYVQYYDKKLEKLMPPSTAEYPEIIKFLSGKKVSLGGDGVERFLNKPSGLSLHCIKMHKNPPIARLADAAIQKYESKSTDFPKPLYLKAPDVCIK